MLDGLDAVPWGTLTHAYGSASDVPQLLRDLAAGDHEVLNEFFGNIWHQGTVYEATAHAVPFLIELLDHEGVDTAGVLQLLACVAGGSSYADVHRDLEPPSTRDSDGYRATIERELHWVRAARDAVAAGAPTYLRLLREHGDEQVRAQAAHTLATPMRAALSAPSEPSGPSEPSAERAAQTASMMHRQLERDPAPLVRASLILATDTLGAGLPGGTARWLTDPDPLPRLAAALIAVGAPGEPPGAVVEVLERDAPACLDMLASLPAFDGADSLEALLPWLRDRWETQRRLLSAWMRNPDAAVRKSAVYAAEAPIHAWRAAAEWFVPELAARLSDPSKEVRYWAASHLASAGRAARLAADELWALLGREPARGPHAPATYALLALCKLHDRRAAEHVLQRLTEGTSTSLSNMDSALRTIGPWAADLRDALVRAIPTAPAGNTRIAVIGAVGRICVADPRAVGDDAIPAIMAQSGSHPHITSRVLGDLGPLAIQALPRLRSLLEHTEVSVRINAARAVWRVAADPEPLREAFRADRRRTGWQVFEAVAELGPSGADLAGELRRAMRSEDTTAMKAAIAYWRVTGDADPVVPVLVGVLHGEQRGRGIDAARCLGEIGPAARAAIPLLREAATAPYRQVVFGDTQSWVDDDERWQEVCAEALARIQR